MKKRTIISIIIIIATNKYWLIFKPMPVSMDIKGSGTSNIEALLNQKDDDKFNKIKSGKVEINLDESYHVNFYVKRSKFPKRAKFIISNIQTKNDIYLSNIKVGKYEIKNLDKFEINGATVSVKDDKLILKPDFDSITLTYPETLKVRTSIKFDFKIFVIILILTYLLAYKLTDYVADYKSVECKSRIEIIFLTIFFVFLFIPITHINQAEISKQENRTLAKWQPLIKENNEINFEFGKNFNEWFNDRFILRDSIIQLYRLIGLKLAYKIYKFNEIYYNKKTMWAFNPDWINPNDITPEMPKILENIQKLYVFCNKNHIHLYIVTAPVKEEVYAEETYPFKLKTNNGQIFTNQLNESISDIAMFPISELKHASKNDYTYPKSDPHWGEFGGYIAANEFLKFIQKDYPSIKLLEEKDFIISRKTLPLITDWEDSYQYIPNDSGYYYRTLGLKNNQPYLCYKFKDEKSIVVQNYDYNLMIKDTYFPQAKNPQKIFIIGTSYSENFYRFIKYSFRYTFKRKVNNLGEKDTSMKFSRWQNDILKEKPDILVLVVQSKDLQRYYNDLWSN